MTAGVALGTVEMERDAGGESCRRSGAAFARIALVVSARRAGLVPATCGWCNARGGFRLVSHLLIRAVAPGVSALFTPGSVDGLVSCGPSLRCAYVCWPPRIASRNHTVPPPPD